MRLSGFLQYGAILIGAIAMFAGQFFGAAQAFHLGLFLVGAGIGAGGLEAILTRRLSLRITAEGNAESDGAPAVLWGFLVLAVGAAIAGAAYLLDAGLGASAIRRIAGHPGPVLAALGVFSTGTGTLLVMDRRDRGAESWGRLVRVARICAGGGLALAGVTGLALGAWGWMNPPAFERLLRAFAAAVS